MLDNEQKKVIVDALNKRSQEIMTCPMCQNRNFILADGYFNNSMQVDFKTFNLGGPSIPTIAIICSNCGFVSQHALGILGLLSNDSNKNNDEPKK